MASIKVKFRPSTVTGHEGSVYYQIIHERRVRQIITNYKLFSREWDRKHQTISQTIEPQRRAMVNSIQDSIKRDIGRLYHIMDELNKKNGLFSIEDVASEFLVYSSRYSFLNFMGKIIERMRENGKLRTAENYQATLRSIVKFLTLSGRLMSADELMIDSISAELIEAYEAWMKLRGVTPNTTSFYMRILRAVYNRAVESQLIENRNPFRHVYTGVDKTVKRALPLGVIRKIRQLDLSENRSLDMARDMFMMSFYLRGMSFINMAYLKRSDNRNGYIIYRRRKTGQLLTIKWTPEMQSIVDKYPENPNGFLLPILCKHLKPNLNAYRNAGYKINHNLKQIAVMANVPIPLTLYVARHSWASAARSKGIPLSVISQGMGHDSEATTRIYLSSLDTTLIDKANSLIIKSI